MCVSFPLLHDLPIKWLDSLYCECNNHCCGYEDWENSSLLSNGCCWLLITFIFHDQNIGQREARCPCGFLANGMHKDTQIKDLHKCRITEIYVPIPSWCPFHSRVGESWLIFIFFLPWTGILHISSSWESNHRSFTLILRSRSLFTNIPSLFNLLSLPVPQCLLSLVEKGWLILTWPAFLLLCKCHQLLR